MHSVCASDTWGIILYVFFAWADFCRSSFYVFSCVCGASGQQCLYIFCVCGALAFQGFVRVLPLSMHFCLLCIHGEKSSMLCGYEVPGVNLLCICPCLRHMVQHLVCMFCIAGFFGGSSIFCVCGAPPLGSSIHSFLHMLSHCFSGTFLWVPFSTHSCVLCIHWEKSSMYFW